tara:strand:- start:42 stop:752 length:711 start_codon:yes stop_codon:yes gene_type:complete
MKLAGFGCSCVYGFAGVGVEVVKENSVAYQLSKLLEVDWINKAHNGAGNDFIYEKLITSHYSGEINPKDTFVLIGWTESFRRKIFYKDKVWQTFRPDNTLSNADKNYWDAHTEALFSDYFMNTNQNYYDTLKSIIGAYHLLEKYNYKYLMFDSLTVLDDGKGNLLGDYKIDDWWIPKEFVNIRNQVDSYYKEMQYNEFLYKLRDEGMQPFLSEEDHHPNELGAKEFARELFKEYLK